MIQETKTRSIAKAVSNRMINTTATIIIAFILTGSPAIALQFGFIEVITKFMLFYINERIWDKIHFGRKVITPFVIWFTGLPFSGKQQLADELEKIIKKYKIKVQRLDGSDIQTLFPVQGFNREERDAYIMRMGYFTNVLLKNGVSVVASFISPYEKSREYNRKIIKKYVEIYVSTPQEECEKRDEWGMYKKARKGEIENFVGVQETYEKPQNPEVNIDLSKMDVKEGANIIIKYLKNKKYF